MEWDPRGWCGVLRIGIRKSGSDCPLASPTSTPITEVHAGVSLMISFFSFSFIFHLLFFVHIFICFVDDMRAK